MSSKSFNGTNAKFDGGGPVEFNVFLEAFLIEADKRKCKRHFVWKESDIKEDKTVPEEEFVEVRICPLGKEEEHALAIKEEKITRLKKKFKRQYKRISEAFKGKERKKEQTRLANKVEDDIESVNGAFEKSVNDVKSAGDQFDKREREFKEDRATAVALLRSWLGSRPLNIIYEALNKLGPKNALKALKDEYVNPTLINHYLNSITTKMSNLKFTKDMGLAKDHMAWLDKENEILLSHGRGLNDGQLMNYLIKAIDRNKEAKALYSDAITNAKYSKSDREETMEMFKIAEDERDLDAEVKGQKVNYAGAKFVTFAGSATVGRKGKKRSASSEESKSETQAKKGKPFCTRCGGDHYRHSCKEEVYCKPCETDQHGGNVCWKTHPEHAPAWLKKKLAREAKKVKK